MEAAVRRCPSCQTPIPGDQRTCPSCGAISLPGVTGPLADAMLARLRLALGPRYRIEREIGQGGMAVVYLTHDLRHDRPVALKVLRPELSAQLGAERFLREIRIAAQLNHPHILSLHDSGEADGLLFFVMPYVEGESLRQRLGRQGALPLEEAVSIAAEVADGLAYAHDLGVVHRDIKPENILLAHGHAAIADFGIARALAGASTAITTTGMSPGTPIYMSPEQAAGDHALDHRADIYSLGCVLYEMLAGNPPYPGPTPQALLVQHSTSPVPSARAARAEVPEPLDEAVRRAMAKAPSDRFHTAAEFREALGELPAAPPVAAAPFRLTARQRWGLVTGAVLVAATGAILLLGRRPAPPAHAPRAPLKVVVQPFVDRTGWLREMAGQVTEALTQRLQRVPALNVVAYPVVAEMRNAPLDSLRARFSPDRFVVGHVAEAGGRLQITAQVLDARTGTGLPDSSVAVGRSTRIPDSVVEPLSVYVRHAFWNEIQLAERRARVGAAEAWQLVSRARERREEANEAIGLRFDGQGFRSLDAADSLLRVARAKDGASDLIPIDQADIAEKRAFYIEYLGQVLSNLPAALPRPSVERMRALGYLDPLIRSRHGPADAFELRGRIKDGLYRELHADSLLAGAIADYRAATDLDPHLAKAWQELGSAYQAFGQYVDALWAIRHAFEEDAFQLYRSDLLRSQFDAALRAGRFPLAEQACASGAAEAPRQAQFRDCDIELWSRSRNERRWAAVARARADSLAGDETNPLMVPLRELWIAELLARAGVGDSADHVARRATANAPAAWQPFLYSEAAYLRALRNDPDSALALIRAVIRRDATYRRVFQNVAWLVSLRADPRFAVAVGASSP